jgi:antitoxin (DNA-binding transcriptional repressor) of toxin-antitoxin stability system
MSAWPRLGQEDGLYLTMLKVNIQEAKTRLSALLERLRSGEENVIVICKRNVAVAELRATPPRPERARPVGLARGTFEVPEAFFEPLPADILGGFRGNRP